MKNSFIVVGISSMKKESTRKQNFKNIGEQKIQDPYESDVPRSSCMLTSAYAIINDFCRKRKTDWNNFITFCVWKSNNLCYNVPEKSQTTQTEKRKISLCSTVGIVSLSTYSA